MNESRIHRMDEEVYTNERGGKQSKIPYRYDLVPPEAVSRIAEIVAPGAEKYGPNNWRKIPVDEQLNHVLYHITEYMKGNRNDDHLGHALCRMAFAVAMQDADGDHDFKEIV